MIRKLFGKFKRTNNNRNSNELAALKLQSELKRDVEKVRTG